MTKTRWRRVLLLVTLITSLGLFGCGGSDNSVEDVLEVLGADQQQQQPATGPAPILSFRIVNTFPHQTDAFTQGLLFQDGKLFESTGLVGQSSLREVELTTGQVLRQQNNAANIFAEGLASRAGLLYQLTLNSGNVIIWNDNNFTVAESRPIPAPAWGLTLTNQDNFAFSDGTSTIRFLAPTSNLDELRRITVTDNGNEVDRLNELEFINGLIYANRFTTDEIVAINPSTGIVAFRIDLSGIIDKQANNLGGNDVLNGIAFDALQNRLFVTGKRWPFLYEIELVQ